MPWGRSLGWGLAADPDLGTPRWLRAVSRVKSSGWEKLSEGFNSIDMNEMCWSHLFAYWSVTDLKKTNDSIFFHSFLNPFLCFYPLYLLFCFVLERDTNTDFQGEESLESLLLQVMARSHSPPIILDVPEAGAKCDKCQQMNRLA